MTNYVDLRDETSLVAHLSALIDQCEDYARYQSSDRQRALEYYDGKMADLPADADFSKVVSKDIRAAAKKAMPSIMRTLLSNDKIVEYIPTGPEDEDQARQATDYVNHIVLPESDAEEAIHDAVLDWFLVKTGILKWVAYSKREMRTYRYTGQSDEALLGIEGDPDITVIDHAVEPETDPEILAADPQAERHSFTLRRAETRTEIKLEAVERGAFLIWPGAKSIESAPIVGDRQLLTRSDLIERGYDRDVVDGLSDHDGGPDDEADAWSRMGDDAYEARESMSRAMQQIVVYEVYVRLDMDGDGVAEMHKVVLADCGQDDHGKAGGYSILEIGEVDEAPYAAVIGEREAHQFEGHSIAEDLIDVQRVRTSLTRDTLDNVYWINRPQPAIDPSQLTTEGLEAIYRPKFGKPIPVKPGGSIDQAIQWPRVPFVADKSFGMLDYWGDLAEEWTGITDRSGGMDADALQNVAAFTARVMEDKGLAQSEMVIRTLARGGIRKAFRGLLGLVITHADKPRTIRLRSGEWAEYDPRVWNADLDCVVNTGLGAGSRERDLAALQMILGLQRELLAAIGPNNPYVKPEQLYNVLEKIVESAGLPNVEPYFTKPDPAEVAQQIASGQGPSEAEQKITAQMQLEAFKAEMQREKEQAQMDADLRVKQAEAMFRAEMERMKLALEVEKHNQKIALEYAKAGMMPPQPIAPEGAM